MTRLNDPAIKYRTLFTVRSNHHVLSSYPEIYVGISENGDLLYITETVVCFSAAMGCETTVYKISKQEYREQLEIAKNNGLLQEAIEKGKTTLKEAVMLGEESF
ncbi:MAG: hypothetical protein IKI77_06765 [Oscillospiraceae bacterium]|nr:hypothetical protein [Oscillospiraceae bacterium]